MNRDRIDETPEHRAERQMLEAACLELGRRIARSCGELGFVLVMFDKMDDPLQGQEGSSAYMSNVEREDALGALRELLQRIA